MYNVPVLAYSEDGLSLLATQIGKPIMLDAFTSSMCMESWGRISFARALIEIDVAVGLKKEVSMAIPAEEGDGHIKERGFLDSGDKKKKKKEGVSSTFGHDTSLCPKRVYEEVPNISDRYTKATVMEEKDDGFKEVKSRKKKGADSRTFGGLRLNKPNSKAGFTSFGTSVGGGKHLEDEDSDFYDGYEDQVVDLHGALKEYRDFMLSMS
nr:hypothetical protein [Tanacetum cinerariifolium]